MPRSRLSSFTLVELLIVIAILAVLAAAVVVV
ncbi:MAG: prepilin-type N-terminal cleavage/methylation domain-containing protein, partial [Candidatus Colwellbacteria bacterium]|nr:prepilin-type N-terminal cleavage/methylation domain-containing protein [Candidatus Colwellbacteria bacterium]